MEDLVSIIIPVYNVERYLRRCLDSVISQSYRKTEIILVDDGSTDGSYEILKQYKNSDDRVVLLHKENGGLGDARNYGIKHASGVYLAFIDSDDFIDETMIEKLYKAVDKENADLAVCDMFYYFEDGTKKLSSGGNFEDKNNLLLENNSACNKLYHRRLFSQLEFKKARLYEDLALIPILFLVANKIVKIDEALYFYVQRENSIVHSLDERIFDIYKSINDIENYVLLINKQDVYKNQIGLLYINNGLYLTSIRIKNANNTFKEKRSYLLHNIDCIDEYYCDWKKSKNFKMFDKKQRILIWLLSHRLVFLFLMITKKASNLK